MSVQMSAKKPHVSAAFLAPFGAPFYALRREIDRIFDQVENGGVTTTLRLDLCETDTEIVVTAEMPGVEMKDIDVSLVEDVLTIRGEKKSEREEKKANYQVIERSFGSFERRLIVPEGVDVSKIKAELSSGVLRVTVPKPPAAQKPVNKIEVTKA